MQFWLILGFFGILFREFVESNGERHGARGQDVDHAEPAEVHLESLGHENARDAAGALLRVRFTGGADAGDLWVNSRIRRWSLRIEITTLRLKYACGRPLHGA
jgi:hypothetical protein